MLCASCSPAEGSTPISCAQESLKKTRRQRMQTDWRAHAARALEETMAHIVMRKTRSLFGGSLLATACSRCNSRAGSRAGQRHGRPRLLRQRLAGGAREGAQAVRSGEQREGPLHRRKLGRQRRPSDRGAQSSRRRRRDGRGNDLRPGTRRRHLREARSSDRQEPRQHRAGSQDGRRRCRRDHAGDRLLLPH